MSEPYVIGIGMTRFTKHQRGPVELGEEAVAAALDDAGVGPSEVEALYAGHVHAGPVAAQRVGAATGLAGIPTLNLENACASGTTAVIEAVHAVRAGRYDCVVACGFEQVSTLQGMITPAAGDYEGELGLVFPGWYAMRARIYMDEYALTRQQLSLVAVKNRHNGSLNPLSHFRQEVSEDDVSTSRPIATPLRLQDCCPKSDGGAAVVIGSERYLADAKRRHGRAVRIAGASLTSGRADGLYEPLFEDITFRAASSAYSQAGVTPELIDFCEVHDCFTIAEGLRVEALGLTAPGTYFRELQSTGRWTLEGGTPVNPSGGLLAKGHPLGATGVAQLCEITTQMRGLGGERQLGKADIALAHTRGGSVPGTEGASCGVVVCIGD